eukprot:COSAG01_NODE_757_length_13812_cov_11.540582_14_plen_172_part_00
MECTQLQADAMRGHYISDEHFSVIKMATTELQGNICVWCGGPAGEDQPCWHWKCRKSCVDKDGREWTMMQWRKRFRDCPDEYGAAANAISPLVRTVLAEREAGRAAGKGGNTRRQRRGLANVVAERDALKVKLETITKKYEEQQSSNPQMAIHTRFGHLGHCAGCRLCAHT